jgi:DNA (cytosine-5)-methyltransferase 1
MSRPRLLDLYCGAGGAARGYYDAGFDVVGVDIAPQPDYPYEFHQGDAHAYCFLGQLGWLNFDAIHASPPCQRYTAMKSMWNHRGDEHPDLVAPTRQLLTQIGLPWVIENVPGAPMAHSIMLCGTMFGLGIEGHGGRELRRHRLFETSFPIMQPECQHQRATIGLYGDHARDRRRTAGSRGVDFPDRDKLALGREAMGMPWVTKWRGLSEAIPPAYTEYIGAELLRQLGSPSLARAGRPETEA